MRFSLFQRYSDSYVLRIFHYVTSDSAKEFKSEILVFIRHFMLSFTTF
jgi:hypothetical protein